MSLTPLLVSRPNCSGCGRTSSLLLLCCCWTTRWWSAENLVCAGAGCWCSAPLHSSALLAGLLEVEISGLIVTVGQGAGYCWLLLVAGLLITALCRRLTLSLVWRLVTALTQGRQSTVCSAYDLDYNNARLLAYL